VLVTKREVVAKCIVAVVFAVLAYAGFRLQFSIYQRNHPGATITDMMFDPEVKR
jgi:hypothetical protein